MKNILRPTIILSGLFLLVMFLSSFSLIDAREDSRIDSREEKMSKREQRRHDRFEKQKENISHKISHAKNDKQKQALQKKLRGIQQKQEGGNPVFGAIGMGLAILAILLLIILAITATAGLMMGGINPLGALVFPLIVAAAVAGLVGLGMSITGMALYKKDSDKWGGKGFAIVGIILGAIATFIGFLAMGIYIIFQ